MKYDLSLFVRADHMLYGKHRCLRPVHAQAARLVCRGEDGPNRGFVLSRANRSDLADALYDLYRMGLLTREGLKDGVDDPVPGWVYHPGPLARHIAVYSEIEPMPGEERICAADRLYIRPQEAASG